MIKILALLGAAILGVVVGAVCMYHWIVLAIWRAWTQR